jgi:hypothetical protein
MRKTYETRSKGAGVIDLVELTGIGIWSTSVRSGLRGAARHGEAQTFAFTAFGSGRIPGYWRT